MSVAVSFHGWLTHLSMYILGKPMKLSPEAEEVATFFAKMLDHEYTTKDIFRKNFFKDWRKVGKMTTTIIFWTKSKLKGQCSKIPAFLSWVWHVFWCRKWRQKKRQRSQTWRSATSLKWVNILRHSLKPGRPCQRRKNWWGAGYIVRYCKDLIRGHIKNHVSCSTQR